MANAEVGSAYVSIYPQTDGNFSKLVGQQLDKGSTGLSAKAVALGNVMAGALMKVADVAANAIGDTISDAFWDYAAYEQLVGGVDKLFGDASQQVQSYAAIAYKTSGMSANQYMEQVTGFSAALINSLDGDTRKAADMADVAMRAMSDNVNTFGTDAASVQNAIMGISRENYTMIDNLKLGYSGSKEGFAELIADANEYAESIGEVGDMTTDSFADAIRALDLIQQKQNIAGTTSKEAASTLEGSINMAKAAWENFLTSFGQDAATLKDRAEQLVESLATVGGNVAGYVSNVVSNLFVNIASALGMTDEDIAKFQDMFVQLGDTMANNVFPYFEQAGQAFANLGKTMEPFTSVAGPALLITVKGILELVSALVGAIVLLAAKFADAASNVIQTAGDMWNGAGEAIEGLNQAVADGWRDLKEWTADAWENIQKIPDEAMESIRGACSSALGYVQGVFSRVWGAVTGTVSNAIGSIRSTVGRVTSIVGTVQNAFNRVKSAIEKPINDAKAAVKGAIDAIKGFFPLNIGKIFSNLQLPHISVSGGSPPFGIGGKGSLPSFSVSWFAKGGFVDEPTLIGAGERGTEMVLPRRGHLMDEFSSAVASKVGGGNEINVYLQYDASADATQMATDLARILNRKLAMEA